jgi:translation elongation factor EF-1beta
LSNALDREILGSIRCRIGELLTLKEQFQGSDNALKYFKLALQDTQVRGKTYHWAEVVNSYLTARYFAGDGDENENENEPAMYDQELRDYEKQLEDISAFKERYLIIFGKLRITQGNMIFSRYFQREPMLTDMGTYHVSPRHSEVNVKELRQMLRDYVEACDFMAHIDDAQFSLAIRVLIVRIRMIRDKQTLEEIKKGLGGIWLDQPHLKEKELATLIEFIQTMQDIILSHG